MKIIFLLFPFLLTSSLFAQTTKINRHVKNGGCDGYSSVSSWWSTDAKGNDVCNIKCKDPGREPCPTICATQTAQYGALIHQAEQMILSGVLSGVIHNTDINARVEWLAVLNPLGTYDADFVVIQY